MTQSAIPEDLELKSIIDAESEQLAEALKAEVGELETTYIEARKKQRQGIALILFAFILNMISASYITLGILLLCLFLAYKLMSGKQAIINQFNASVNKVVFAKAFSLLKLDAKLVDNEEVTSTTSNTIPVKAKTNFWADFLKGFKKIETAASIIALDRLTKSELITENHNTNQVDNIFEINYQQHKIIAAELDIKHITGSGKNRNTKYIFHGYFISISLNKVLSGKTFVSSENDKNGFGNLSFWNNSHSVNAKETLLEWNDFEDLLHVATTDEVEARYILTPDFMLDLYTWWNGQKGNIRLSFIQDNMYILFPDNQIRLDTTIEKISKENVAEYTHSIARPLRYVIKLLDDVRM
jgi:Protein of unknown function (DUF3137)